MGYTGGEISATPIYVRLKAGLAVGDYNGELIANSGGGATIKNVTVNGSVSSIGGVADHLVIAEIYGGGGNSLATYTHDYIVLYNPTGNPVDLSTWSVQYASAAGDFNNQTNLVGAINPGEYYLIQQSGGSNGIPLPVTPNVIGGINLSQSSGKVALVNNQTAITGITDENVVDFVRYGPAANEYEGVGPALAPSATSSIRRKDNSNNNTYGINGSGWDSDNNVNDFYVEPDLVNNPPLPVELSYFSASIIGSSVKLNWITETEQNNYGFEVERKVGSL